MERHELLKSREYWIVQIQNQLFQLLENFRKEKHLNKTGLAKEFGVTKGYISQVLNGDFDHKISKLVDLSLACNYAPFFHYLPLDLYIQRDAHCGHGESVSFPRPISYSINIEGSPSVAISGNALRASAYFSRPVDETVHTELPTTSVSSSI